MTNMGTANHGVCLMAQATPSEIGPIHRASPGSLERPYLSQRQTAMTRNGRNIASVPPDVNEPKKNGVKPSNAASHRNDAGSSANKSTIVASQATRSVQSTAMCTPSAVAGRLSRNDPAG